MKTPTLPSLLGVPVHVMGDDKGLMNILVNQLSVKADESVFNGLSSNATTSTGNNASTSDISLDKIREILESIPKPNPAPTHVVVSDGKIYAMQMPRMTVADIPAPVLKGEESAEAFTKIFFRQMYDHGILPRRPKPVELTDAQRDAMRHEQERYEIQAAEQRGKTIQKKNRQRGRFSRSVG
jgi:hypothetical protein